MGWGGSKKSELGLRPPNIGVATPIIPATPKLDLRPPEFYLRPPGIGVATPIIGAATPKNWSGDPQNRHILAINGPTPTHQEE